MALVSRPLGAVLHALLMFRWAEYLPRNAHVDHAVVCHVDSLDPSLDLLLGNNFGALHLSVPLQPSSVLFRGPRR